MTDNEFDDGLPALALSPAGQGLVAWTSANDTALVTRGDWEIIYVVRNDGEWGDPQNLTDDENADCSVDLAFSGAGGGGASIILFGDWEKI